MRWSNAGSPGIAKLNVPSPVIESSPRKISVPMPAASRPGTSTRPSIGPPRPEASSSRNAPISGEPSSELIAAKLPVAAITAAACRRRVARRQADGEHAERAAHQDQRRLGTEDGPEGERGEGGEEDAGELGGRHRS